MNLRPNAAFHEDLLKNSGPNRLNLCVTPSTADREAAMWGPVLFQTVHPSVDPDARSFFVPGPW